MEIRDPFVHEAAHALVYNALDMQVARVWVQAEDDDPRREGGLTERGTDAQMNIGAGVLEFMAGAAVLTHIFSLSFDRAINKTKSDFCTILRLLGANSEEEAETQLEYFRRATDDFVREWVLTNKDPIMRLATRLQQSPVSDKRWELSGNELHGAMQISWNGRRPSAHMTQEFTEARWARILSQSIQADDKTEWKTLVLRHCREENARLQESEVAAVPTRLDCPKVCGSL